MKGNKGKEVTSEGARHEVESQVRPSTGIKGRLCPRTWIWKISPVDEARKPGMARTK